MSMLLILVPLSLLLVAVAIWAFLWAAGAGQFDDLQSPAWDMLSDAEAERAAPAEQATWPQT